jgi:ArsR family transcriptional regulator
MPTSHDVSIGDDVLSRAATVIKCLGHPLRLRLLEALEQGERTVSELQEYADMNQAAVSQQLATLKARGIVDSRREGTFVYYRIVEPKVNQILQCIRDCDV